jgi:putative copper resistance protein D
MTLGWNGHAAATEGLVGLLHRFNNGVHLVAAGLWLGAVSWFLRLTVKVHIQQDQMAAKALLVTMHRFAPLGVSLVVTIAITGLVNSQMIFGLVNSGEVLKSEYGVLLLAKLVLVGGMLTFGARNAAVARRVALAQDGRKIDTYMALAALHRSLIGEFIVAGLVIAVVAIVGMMSPVPM